MNHELNITRIETKDYHELSNYVVHIKWDIVFTDDNGNTNTQSGGNNFDAPTTSEGVTPFAELTEAQVKEWCETKITNDGLLSYMEDVAIEKIAEELETQASEQSLPW